MKVKLEFFKYMGIMLANLCHLYILSTTVLSDKECFRMLLEMLCTKIIQDLPYTEAKVLHLRGRVSRCRV